MKLHTYLNYGGNCAEAFRFYEKHLGGKITMMMTYGQQAETAKAHPDLQNDILHARMTIGGTDIMASDTPKEAR